MAAVGEIENIESFEQNKSGIKKILPDSTKHKEYMKKFGIYKEIYNSLEKLF